MNNWKRAKPSIRLGMTKHQVDHHFQVGDQVWLYISKEHLKGEGKNIKPIRYGPFKILENIGDNDFSVGVTSISVHSNPQASKIRLQ
jgi:hypothetical protein